ncbi:hypothetical protein E2562_036732 [Oryza meyeriana var. granulata]|uniref:Uncharacterized protein n=1 Tax=Oryza meyeriana var. granulata TaxID=110450 RepID=A0A6G1E7N8_9ORYZ|nr:hypothetical protein E2562_036732 [Oryza meyeriana var. granulata]
MSAAQGERTAPARRCGATRMLTVATAHVRREDDDGGNRWRQGGDSEQRTAKGRGLRCNRGSSPASGTAS